MSQIYLKGIDDEAIEFQTSISEIKDFGLIKLTPGYDLTHDKPAFLLSIKHLSFDANTYILATDPLYVHCIRLYELNRNDISCVDISVSIFKKVIIEAIIAEPGLILELTMQSYKNGENAIKQKHIEHIKKLLPSDFFN
jgi:hypothetical protein